MDSLIVKNKQNLKSLIKFICFLIVLYCVFSRVTWLYRSNGIEAREDIYGFRNQGHVDVVLCAGSNLLRYYQPLEAWNQKGYTSYNYATSGAKADLLKAYIEDSRVSNEATLYVCDIRSFPMVTDTVDDLSLRNWSDSLPVFSYARWKGISSFLFNRNREGVDILSYYFDIIKYHTNSDVLKSDYQWNYQDLNSIYNIDKGFDPNKGHIPFDRPERIYDIGTLTDQQEKAIDELLDYCDDNDLNVLFICCPYIIAESDWLTLNAVGEKITDRGYTYVNFNDYYDEIGLDFETDFGDVNHVNYLGAEKYTKYLMNYISDNYELPDHRGDVKYKGWDKDYEIYAATQKEWKNAITTLVESHINAKKNGEQLHEKTDFYDWYSGIRDANYSVIIRIDKMPLNIGIENPLFQFMKDYGIEQQHNSYIGVWIGEDAVLSAYDKNTVEFSVGADGGRGAVPCSIELDSNKLMVGKSDYSISGADFQVLVYDNNYQKLIDNVWLNSNSDDAVELIRP